MKRGPDSIEATSTYMLGEKVKLNKLTDLYKYLDAKNDPNLANLDRIWVKKNNLKTSNTDRSIKEANKLNSSIDLQMEDIPMEKLPKKAKEI